jgi:HEAT repeat protein
VFRFPVTIRVITQDSVVRSEIMISKLRETFRTLLPGPPLSFRFDEGGWLLGTVETDQTPAELAEMAKHDLDFSARIWALRKVDSLTDSNTVAARRFIVLNEPQPSQRVHALQVAAADRSKETVAIVHSALQDPDSDVRAEAIEVLAKLDSAGVATPAESMYRTDPNTRVRGTALRIFAEVVGSRALPLLVSATNAGLPSPLRMTAARELAKFEDPRATNALEQLTLPGEPRDLRIVGLACLAQQRDSVRAAAVAARYLDDEDPLFASAAARVLGSVGGDEGRARLRAREANENRVTVKRAIAEILKSQ